MDDHMVNLAASILSADFARLEAHTREALDAGADWIHVDVMDGHFVPNITMGPLVVQAMRPLGDERKSTLDVHLMIEHPERYIPQFAKAGADILTVQVEACVHLHRTIQLIKEHGVRAGVALNPATSLVTVEEILPDLDLLLIMTVNPGFGGQAFIPKTLGKIKRARRMLDDIGSIAYLEVDGGIGPGNVAAVWKAGADVFVAGTSIFGGEEPVARNIQSLKDALTITA